MIVRIIVLGMGVVLSLGFLPGASPAVAHGGAQISAETAAIRNVFGLIGTVRLNRADQQALLDILEMKSQSDASQTTRVLPREARPGKPAIQP